jgi:hypothetical protein
MSRKHGYHTSSRVVQHFRREEQKLRKRGRERARVGGERTRGAEQAVGMKTRGLRVDWTALAGASGRGDKDEEPKPQAHAKKPRKQLQERTCVGLHHHLSRFVSPSICDVPIKLAEKKRVS